MYRQYEQPQFNNEKQAVGYIACYQLLIFKFMKTDIVYEGDCLHLIHEKIASCSINAVICDLPYGTTKCKWDSIIDLPKLWSEYERIIKDNGVIILTAQTPFDKVLGASNLKLLKYEWIWEKTQATGHLNAKKMPMKAHENVLVFYNKLPTYNPQKTTGHKPINSYTKYVKTQNNTEIYGEMKREISGGGETDRYPRSVLTFASDKQRLKLHSTQKPLSLMEYLVKTYTNKGDIILDNACGSGTTGKAAQNLGRKFIMMEKDPEIYKIACERVGQTN